MNRHRPLLVALGLGTLLAVTGCAGGDDELAPVAGSPTGSASASDPGVVVALDDFAAVHALTLGVQPDLVLDAFQYETSGAIFDAAGLTVEPYGAELDVERVLAAEPDVVIGVSLPTTLEVEDQLSEISDVTVFDYAATWDAQLTDVAAALGREAEAEELIAGLQADVDALRTDVAAAGYDGAVASVLSDNQGLFSVPATTGLGSLLAGAGLARPEAQQQASEGSGPFTEFSSETLTDHDGDLVFVLTGGAYTTDRLYGFPLWDRLAAVQAGRVHEVSGEMWLGTSAFSIDWVLDDLRAVLVDGGEAGTPEEVAERFAAFAPQPG